MCLITKRLSPTVRQLWVVSAVISNKFGQGMVMGISSGLITSLQAKDSEIKIDMETASWLVSSLGISFLVGYPIVSFLMNKCGRRLTYALKQFPAILGLMLTTFASNVTTLMIGRVLTGITIGGTAVLGAVVVGEYTSPRYRGIFLNLKTAFFNFGNLAVHILANFLYWRTVAAVSCIPFVLSLVITYTLPESPSWLAEKKYSEKAEEVFYWLRGKTAVSTKELEALLKNQQNKEPKKSLKESVVGFFSKFKKKNFIKPTIIVMFTAIMCETSGRHFFPSYAAILVKGMISTNTNPFFYTITIDILMTISAFTSSYLIKKFKLRKLLFTTGFISFAILNFSCLTLYLVTKGILSKSCAWVPITFLGIYFFVVNLCVSPIVLTIMGEIFPLEHRAVGSSVCGLSMGVFLILILKIVPVLLVAFNTYGAFAILAACMAIALIVLFFLLPETQGRTLQEIEDFFNYGKFKNDEKLKSDDRDVDKKMINDKL